MRPARRVAPRCLGKGTPRGSDRWQRRRRRDGMACRLGDELREAPRDLELLVFRAQPFELHAEEARVCCASQGCKPRPTRGIEQFGGLLGTGRLERDDFAVDACAVRCAAPRGNGVVEDIEARAVAQQFPVHHDRSFCTWRARLRSEAGARLRGLIPRSALRFADQTGPSARSAFRIQAVLATRESWADNVRSRRASSSSSM